MRSCAGAVAAVRNRAVNARTVRRLNAGDLIGICRANLNPGPFMFPRQRAETTLFPGKFRIETEDRFRLCVEAKARGLRLPLLWRLIERSGSSTVSSQRTRSPMTFTSMETLECRMSKPNLINGLRASFGCQASALGFHQETPVPVINVLNRKTRIETPSISSAASTEIQPGLRVPAPGLGKVSKLRRLCR